MNGRWEAMNRMCKVLAVIALIATVGCSDTQSPKSETSHVPVTRTPSDGIELSEVRFPAIDAAVKEQAGKVVVIDFWATWCPPCVARFPHLVDIQKKYLDRGLVCMSVSEDRDGGPPYNRERVLAFLRKHDARFPNFVLDNLKEDEPELKRRFGLGDSLPFVAILDRSGKVVWNTENDVKRVKHVQEELDAFLDAYMAQK